MKQRKIGTELVGEIGLGCMGMSAAYGQPNDAESLKVFTRALELGVNHWDTADTYGSGENEKLVAKGLKGRRDKVFLATKFGLVFDRSLTSHRDMVDSPEPNFVDGTPAYARKCLENSLKRLEVDYLDLYTLHRVDLRVPIEETVGTMAEFVAEGKVRFIGLSEASVETLNRAQTVHPVSALQSEFSLWTRDYSHTTIPRCKELGIAFVPFSPLGRGFLSGSIKSEADIPEGDWRRNNPRFQGENLKKNLELVAVAERIAAARGATASQVALAWVLAFGDHICPIPGTKRMKFIEENAMAADLKLNPSELNELTELAPPSGDRYSDLMLARLNR